MRPKTSLGRREPENSEKPGLNVQAGACFLVMEFYGFLAVQAGRFEDKTLSFLALPAGIIWDFFPPGNPNRIDRRQWASGLKAPWSGT
jgi:hypothetical protein